MPLEANRKRTRWTYAGFARLPGEGSTRYAVAMRLARPLRRAVEEVPLKVLDRLFVGAHAPGSFLWGLMALVLAGTAWSALFGNGDHVLEGLFSAAVLLGVLSVTSRTLGWKFWPW